MNDYISNRTIHIHDVGTYVTHGGAHPVQIVSALGRSILDSRGFPTVQVDLELADGSVVSGSAPAGASTGAHEAVELRDGGAAFGGKGVRQAAQMVTTEIGDLLTSRPWAGISEIDRALADLDGTSNWSRLGANAVVATSIAASRALAREAGLPLHRWIALLSGTNETLPVPHFNVLNGGAHAANDLDFQEFMIAPVGATSEEEAVQTGAEVYHALKTLVQTRYGTAGLGDEGGFAPAISNPEEALDLIVQAITDAGHRAALDDVAIALDPAANGFGDGDGRYRVAGQDLDRGSLADRYGALLEAYPIRSIEDAFHEDDHDGWALMASRFGGRVQLVGDDLYVTDPRRIAEGAEQGWSDAVLIKPNQIGSVSQTLDAIATARSHGMACMVSHRSGETTDTFIADLVVGTGVGQIKSGAPARGERVCKYNRLTDIEADQPGLSYGLSTKDDA
jgi:enolase